MRNVKLNRRTHESHLRNEHMVVDTRPVPVITAQERDWQREVYEADPVGGSASRY